jgi:hypothetical protein
MMVANPTFPSSYARALACTRHDTRLRLRHAAGEFCDLIGTLPW